MCIELRERFCDSSRPPAGDFCSARLEKIPAIRGGGREGGAGGGEDRLIFFLPARNRDATRIIGIKRPVLGDISSRAECPNPADVRRRINEIRASDNVAAIARCSEVAGGTALSDVLATFCEN